MGYFKGILSGLASRDNPRGACRFLVVFWGISNTKATGLAAVVGGLVENLFSPLFWVPAILLFALFFAASRLGNKLLRVFLFWIPTLTVSAFTIAIVATFAYLFIRFRHS